MCFYEAESLPIRWVLGRKVVLVSELVLLYLCNPLHYCKSEEMIEIYRNKAHKPFNFCDLRMTSIIDVIDICF